jgi:3-oxoacyl-[acyl-carrier-protein] synthase II
MNLDNPDPECELPGTVVVGKPLKADKMEYIANNSFGMLGNNSVLIVKKYE